MASLVLKQAVNFFYPRVAGARIQHPVSREWECGSGLRALKPVATLHPLADSAF